MDFLTPARKCWCDWVSLQLCECQFSVLLFPFLNDGGQSLCIRTRNPPPARPPYNLFRCFFQLHPFKEGINQRDNTHSWGYTQGYQTDFSIHWLCKISLSLIVEQPWSVYETLFHFIYFIIFTLPYSRPVTCHSVLTTSLVVRGGCLIACVHTVLHLDIWI